MVKATVIVSTFKRTQCLIETLRSLLDQNTEDYEIVVVDQSPQAKKDLLDFLEENKNRIRYIRSNTRGLATGRNVGWRQANGEIIIFCDDDILAKRSLVRGHIDSYRDCKIGGVAGRVLTENDRPVCKKDIVGKLRFWDGKVFSNFNANFQTEVDHTWGCNMSFRRELVEKIGGFDERLTGTSSFDDADAALAVKKLGYRIIFEPIATVKHVFAKKGGCRDLSFNEKMYWYYHNFMVFNLRHMKRIFLPIYLVRQISGIFRRSIIKKDLKVILFGIRGLIHGVRDYRSKT